MMVLFIEDQTPVILFDKSLVYTNSSENKFSFFKLICFVPRTFFNFNAW